jgi:protein-disulfide isomerase
MAVPPKFAGTRLIFGSPPAITSASVPHTRHTIEFFLDYCCPYSAKIFNTINQSLIPLISDNSAWAPAVELIFRQQIQPWHPSSTLMHEAALAVLQVAPSKFWDFSTALFKAQRDYFDVNVVNETRNTTYERLAKLAGSVSGVDGAKVLEKLLVPDKPDESGDLNLGNAVTADVKLFTKIHRLLGTHVTPTVIFDGVVQNDVSSSWTADQWKEFLTKNVV